MLEQLKDLYPKKFKYDRVEEHLFQITNIEGKEYKVIPFFLSKSHHKKSFY